MIVEKGHKAQRIERQTIARENYLQEYVQSNPETLPVEELKPGEYFAEMRTFQNPGIRWQGRRPENVSQGFSSHKFATKKTDFIEKRLLIASFRNYENNAFVQFLFGLAKFSLVGEGLAQKVMSNC